MLHLILGNKNYSSWSLRPWLALAETGEPFEETVIPLYEGDWKEQILSHSKAGLVPVLHDGDVTVWESLAICEYLAERHPNLWPTDNAARAHARSVSAEMHGNFGAVREAMPMNVRGVGRTAPSSPDIDRDIRRLSELWTETRAKFGGTGDYLYGSFTNADAMFSSVTSRFKTYGIQLDGVAATYVDTVWENANMKKWRAAAEAEPWVVDKYEL